MEFSLDQDQAAQYVQTDQIFLFSAIQLHFMATIPFHSPTYMST